MEKISISYDHTAKKLTAGLLINGEPITPLFEEGGLDIQKACTSAASILTATGNDEFSLERLTQLVFVKDGDGNTHDPIEMACGMGHVSVLGSDELQAKLARQLNVRTTVDPNKTVTFERFATHCTDQVVPEEVPEGVDIDVYKAVMSIIVWCQLLVTMTIEARRKKGS